MGSDVVGSSLHLVTGVGSGDGQSANTHDREIDHIVSHVGDLLRVNDPRCMISLTARIL
jgi:hypothetical protein